MTGFDTSSDSEFTDRLYIPGLRRAGDLQTAASLARGRIVVHNAGARFGVSGIEIQPRKMTAREIADVVRSAGGGQRAR